MFNKNKLIVYEELNGEFFPVSKPRSFKILKQTIKLAAPILISTATTPFLAPYIAFANTGDPINTLYTKVLTLFDSLALLVIVFAGGAWMMGHRSKAINILIGACCGYALARSAVPIRDFMKEATTW